MRIAVNTRLLLPHRLDGIGWFTYETLRRIVDLHPEHEFFFFFDRRPDPQFLFAENIHPVVLVPQARRPVLWYMFFEWSVTRALRKYKIDVFLSTDGWMSLRTDVPTLTVVHDLNFEHATDYLRPSYQRYMKHFFPRFVSSATRVATVSEFSKGDIVATYGTSADKIDVVYDGAHDFYRPCTEEIKAETRREYSEGKPYFIFVGTVSRRKNLTNMLLAFDEMKIRKSSDLKFIVVGSRGWWQDELKAAYEGLRFQRDVIFLGHVEADVLARLMASSVALVYASLFEGFGIPVLEAFYAETAVIASTTTSIPEVAGDAALMVEPHSVSQIADAMTRLLEDDTLRQELIEKGREQRKLFSWDRTASLLWDSLMRTCVQAGLKVD